MTHSTRFARRRLVALAGAAALLLPTAACGSGNDRPAAASDAQAAPSPSEASPPGSESEQRPRDLAPEGVVGLPQAVVEDVVVGADLDRRAVTWRAGGREVLAITTDGGDSWSYQGEPGQYFDLVAAAPGSDDFWVSSDGGGSGRGEFLVDARGDLVEVAPPRGLAPVGDGEALVLHLPRRNAERQVAVASDGTSHFWPGDPFYEEQRTGDVGGWEPGVQHPFGRIVQQVAGEVGDVGGLCCGARPLLRWSDDGGATWTTRSLDDLGAEEGTFFPFALPIPSLDPDTVAVHESTEGGTRLGRPWLATQRFAADAAADPSGGERFVSRLARDRVNVVWSVVLPDGELLAWVGAEGSSGVDGAWASDGDDWSQMSRVGALDPPAGVDVGGLTMVDTRLVDGRARVTAVAASGAMLLLEGDDVTWTTVDPSR